MRLVSPGVWIGLLVMLMVVPVGTHAAPGEPVSPQAAPAMPEAPARVLSVRINGVDGREARFGDSVDIQLSREAMREFLLSKEKLRLYLDARPIPALVVLPNPARDQLRFVLARNERNRGEWAGLLNEWRDREVLVGVGLDDGPRLVDDQPIHMRLFSSGRTMLAVGLGALLVVGMLVAGSMTSMLRDPAPGGAKVSLEDRVYSLGRTQMAWWTVMIVLALLALWWLTGSVEPVSGSMLALMGIGAGTFLSAVLIDSGKPADTAVKPRDRRGFFFDLLSEDGSELSLHRFQMMVWTVIVTVAFWTAVVKQLALPDIDPTLLGLLGISNGTYLGFKAR